MLRPPTGRPCTSTSPCTHGEVYGSPEPRRRCARAAAVAWPWWNDDTGHGEERGERVRGRGSPWSYWRGRRGRRGVDDDEFQRRLRGGRRDEVGAGVASGSVELQLMEGIDEDVVVGSPGHSGSPCRALWPRVCSSAATSCARSRWDLDEEEARGSDDGGKGRGASWRAPWHA